ncbi:MAG: cadherin domain-containing protein, partial [Porticoccus sp.]|nr:cadherin domain-containing protein [Porticoccus sp.]
TLANVDAGDTLSFGATDIDLNTNGATGPDANGFSYTVSSAGASPVITITHAGADDATVNTMLNSAVFNNTTHNDPSTTARTVTFTSVTDSGSGLTADGTVATINVAVVNDAPMVATNTGTTVNEGSAGTVITTAMLNEGDPDDDGSELTYTITAVTGNGTLSLNGFGVLGLSDTFTQAEIDAGDVTYDHNGSNTTSDSFSFSLADGGEDGASPAMGSFIITVNAIDDDTATVVNQGITVNEGDTNTVLTTSDLSSSDADTDDATLIYTVGDVANGSLTIGGTAWAVSSNDTFTQQDIIDGNVLYTHDGLNTNSDSFSYTVEDPIGNQLTGQTFSITVNAVGGSLGAVVDADVVANRVDEDAVIGTPVGITGLAIDPDTADSVIYSLSDDAGGLFDIDPSSGVVAVAGTLNFEAAESHSVTVLATSTDTTTSSQSFVINVSDVDASIYSDGDEFIPEKVDGKKVDDKKIDDEDINKNLQKKSANDGIDPRGAGGDGLYVKGVPFEQGVIARGVVDADKQWGVLLPINDDVLASVMAESDDIKKRVPLKFLDLNNLDIVPFKQDILSSTESTSMMNNRDFVSSLDQLGQDLDDAVEKKKNHFKLGAEITLGVTISLVAGMVSWIFKGGSLLMGYLSVLPLWQQFDPFPVLATKKRKNKNHQDERENSDEDNIVEDVFKSDS